MLDPELKIYLDEFKDQFKKQNRGVWRAFFNGIFSGLGSVVGAALAIVVIGWILNVVGVIPALRAQVDQIKSLIGQVQQYRSGPGAGK